MDSTEIVGFLATEGLSGEGIKNENNFCVYSMPLWNSEEWKRNMGWLQYYTNTQWFVE